jgi:hypothetical protein
MYGRPETAFIRFSCGFHHFHQASPGLTVSSSNYAFILMWKRRRHGNIHTYNTALIVKCGLFHL